MFQPLTSFYREELKMVKAPFQNLRNVIRIARRGKKLKLSVQDFESHFAGGEF